MNIMVELYPAGQPEEVKRLLPSRAKNLKTI